MYILICVEDSLWPVLQHKGKCTQGPGPNELTHSKRIESPS